MYYNHYSIHNKLFGRYDLNKSIELKQLHAILLPKNTLPFLQTHGGVWRGRVSFFRNEVSAAEGGAPPGALLPRPPRPERAREDP